MDDTPRAAIARRMGQRVRLGRALRGVSAAELARRAGVRPQRLRRIEQGTAGTTADELVALARALNVPLWFVFEVPPTADPGPCPVCGATRPARSDPGNRS